MSNLVNILDVPWQQGMLLNTNSTRHWTTAQKDECNRHEQKMAFAFFTAEDEGRSRKHVRTFDTNEECAEAVKAHNKSLNLNESNV